MLVDDESLDLSCWGLDAGSAGAALAALADIQRACCSAAEGSPPLSLLEVELKSHWFWIRMGGG